MRGGCMGRLGPIFFTALFFFFFVCNCLGIGASRDDCPPSRCRRDGPEIRFPFRRTDYPKHCGYPGFELACHGDDTVIKLPSSSGNFSVRDIVYDKQILLIESKSCPASILLNLNVSNSPFHFFFYNYDFEDEFEYYTFLNCSTANNSIIENLTDYLLFEYYYHEIHCLSESHNRIVALPSSFSLANLPEPCTSINTVQAIWPYVHYLYHYSSAYDEYVPPTLKWDSPDCSRCETGGGICRPNISANHGIGCIDQSGGGICRPNISASHEIGQCKNQSLQHNHRGVCKKSCIIGVVLGILVLLATTAIAIKVSHSWLLERKREKEKQLKVEKFLEDYKALKPMRYSYADIKKIANQFKTKLGEGGYGSVFKGLLPNGVPVAVKILGRYMGSNGEDFINEVGTIGRIHHVNVVRLLGFCADGVKRALIYEFMPNESLAKFIFSVDGGHTLLGWDKLHDIAVGIARGIEYLHQGCDHRILHFDIKPHNILLDEHLSPKISDFGLAKLCSKEQSAVSMTAARGTAGYIAPEVYSSNFGNVSYKSDVYSFGMLLLEMVGGRKNLDATVENTSQMYFPEWIYHRLCQGEELGLRIVEENDSVTAKKLTIVALWCIQWYPVDRPSMKIVVQMLEGNMVDLAMPPNPFTSAIPPNTDAALPDRPVGTNLTTIPEICSEQEADA